ncbi:MAG TPA: RNA polymerase sigma factor [Candidatus Hydrogenedentes bacterium]|nr:RNA polymerase sigma factor [Candidatus Hydrogenedentota bacterium]HPG69262.1 RNA polymerase sigma factor [Candidatus Hydrogenedentota bacterium]
MRTERDIPPSRGRAGGVDEDFLEEVARRDGRTLLAYARSVTGNVHDADDALQEAFAKVAGRRLARIGNLRAYLYRAVRNAALNSIRERSRRARREETAGAEMCRVFQKSAARREEVEALEEALRTLPSEQREVVILKVWGGLSFAEVAEVVGVPRDTAASRYRYAIEALRRQMRRFTDA